MCKEFFLLLVKSPQAVLLHTFKVHFSIPIRVEYVDNPLHQWVLLQLWQRHELLHAEWARVI